MFCTPIGVDAETSVKGVVSAEGRIQIKQNEKDVEYGGVGGLYNPAHLGWCTVHTVQMRIIQGGMCSRAPCEVHRCAL